MSSTSVSWAAACSRGRSGSSMIAARSLAGAFDVAVTAVEAVATRFDVPVAVTLGAGVEPGSIDLADLAGAGADVVRGSRDLAGAAALGLSVVVGSLDDLPAAQSAGLGRERIVLDAGLEAGASRDRAGRAPPPRRPTGGTGMRGAPRPAAGAALPWRRGRWASGGGAGCYGRPTCAPPAVQPTCWLRSSVPAPRCSGERLPPAGQGRGAARRGRLRARARAGRRRRPEPHGRRVRRRGVRPRCRRRLRRHTAVPDRAACRRRAQPRALHLRRGPRPHRLPAGAPRHDRARPGVGPALRPSTCSTP